MQASSGPSPDELELVPISALQHLVYCERQFALIHVERQWVENRYTAEGRQLHDTADSGAFESRGEVRIARSLSLRSLGLRLIGKADVVEFHRCESPCEGTELPGVDGEWVPFPVEYKRGQPKSHEADRVQLCAQALCLEEMLNTSVPGGALFYGKTRRREEVSFDDALRERTQAAATRAHELLDADLTPNARRQPKCRRCSLLEICRPATIGRSVDGYLSRVLGPSVTEYGS